MGLGFVPERRSLDHFALDQLAMYGFALVPALLIAGLRLSPRERLIAAGAVVAILPLALVDDLGGPALALVLAGAAGALALRPQAPPLERAGALLLAMGLGCVATAELVYLRDAFDDTVNFRFNTAFKVGFDAWLLFAAAAALLLAAAARSVARWGPVVVLLAAGAISYPPAAAWVHTGGFAGDAHLDGLRWLSALAPGDPPAIAWLREHAPRGTVVLEANGPEYSAQGHGRISVFSGRPTVLGWAAHELFYHAPEALGTRAQDVALMYQGDAGLLRRYGVRYVVVGPLERMTLAGLGTYHLARRFFARGGTEIYATG
jgi:uncharacterized membrane protein